MNILSALQNLVTVELVTETANHLGEDNKAVSHTLHQAIPTVLAGLLNAAPTHYPEIERLLQEASQHDTSIENVLDKGVKAHSMASYFKSFQQAIFGDKTRRIIHILENDSTTTEESIPALLKIASSVVATFLGKKMSVQNMNFSTLINSLGKEKDAILAAAPHDIQSALGITPNVWGTLAETPTMTATAPLEPGVHPADPMISAETTSEPPLETNNMKWIWPLVLLAALAAGLIWLLSKNGCHNVQENETAEIYSEENTVAHDTVQVQQSITIINGELDADGNWIAAKGDTIDIKLEDGTELVTTRGSVTDKLYNFLREPQVDANKNKPENWFDVDDVLFSSGSSQLKRGAEDQIKNVIAVLKAFPSAQIKLGGYTDNTGSEEGNKKISSQRAKAVYTKMISMGADKASFDAEPYEGYGSQYPVCPANDTPECQAQNRRIALVVTSK